MAGRSNGFDENIAKKIIEALSDGNTRTASVGNAGIDYHRFQRWMAKNDNFASAIKEAESQAEVGNVATIARAAKDGTWQAAAWWLERRRHEDWRKREDVNIGNQGDRPLKVEVEYISVASKAIGAASVPALPAPDAGADAD